MAKPALIDIDSLWDFNDPVATEAKFRELVPIAETGGDEAYLSELLSQLARTQSLQRKFDESHAILDRAETLPASKGGRPRLRILLERGRAYNSSGKKDLARPLFIEAWELGDKLGEDRLAVDAAHMIAIVESGEEALRWNLIALGLAITSEDPGARRWRKSLHNNIGWTYFEMGDRETALGHFRKSREAAEEMGDVESERIARWCIGKSLRVLGKVEEALEIQEQLQKDRGGQDAGYGSEEMGECLYALGRAEEAKPYFARAHAALSKDSWLVEREPERLARLLELSV
ncbi:MAG TPA: tetratricopeptide repeat protein [Fimbriimonadaceae bacterium]|nr:tetratricopeptide repeat protein [Fimbriimonadaceae bacterium]